MMPIISIQERGAALEAKLPQLQAALASGLDFAEVERALQEAMAQLTATMLERLLATLMQEPGFVAQLKRFGGRLGMRLKEYRQVRLWLSWGQEIEVNAPYFIKAAPQRGRRKRGPNGHGAYLGLDALGFLVELRVRALALRWNFCPSSPSTVKKHQGQCRPAERLNGKRYTENWLGNLLVSGSMNGLKHYQQNPLLKRKN
jgi:hypothetical protein